MSEAEEDRPLRVVVVGHTAQLSGGELAISRLIAAMPSIDVHVVLAQDGPLVDVLESAGATVEVLPMGERARDLRKDRVRIGGVPMSRRADRNSLHRQTREAFTSVAA